MIPRIIKGKESVIRLNSLSTDHPFGLEFIEIVISRNINSREFEKSLNVRGWP